MAWVARPRTPNNAGKNWTFAGSGEGDHRAAAIYS
jgi:hypothetical protein